MLPYILVAVWEKYTVRTTKSCHFIGTRFWQSDGAHPIRKGKKTNFCAALLAPGWGRNKRAASRHLSLSVCQLSWPPARVPFPKTVEHISEGGRGTRKKESWWISSSAEIVSRLSVFGVSCIQSVLPRDRTTRASCMNHLTCI